MKAYFAFKNAKDKLVIDCIEMKNKNTEEKLYLTFQRNEVGLGANGTCYIRQSILDPDEYGVPKSLKENYGDTKTTYEFIKHSKIISIIIHNLNSNVLTDLSLSNLVIFIGNYRLDFENLDKVKLEELCI